MNSSLFINKFQPLFFSDFEMNPELTNILNAFIEIEKLNLLLVGNMGCGKTSILNALIREYYKGFTSKEYEFNVLQINNLKEQGINYYRNDVKTFCQTSCSIKHKKKISYPHNQL